MPQAPELVLRKAIRVRARRIGAVAQLLMIGGGTSTGEQNGYQNGRDAAHFFFFFRAGAAVAGSPSPADAGAGGTSDRDSSARYASTRGSSRRRACSSSQTARAARPPPAREHDMPRMAAAPRKKGGPRTIR